MRTTSIVVGVLAATLSCGVAQAADMVVKGPIAKAPAAVVAYSWSGFYLGGQIGYAWGKDDVVETLDATGVVTATGSYKPSGIKGGAHIGYNYQVGALVLGLEADIEATDVKKTASPATFGWTTDYIGAKIDWQGSFRGRIGYAFDRFLVYATGGLAFADINHTYYSPPVAETIGDIYTGWTVGGGVEVAFSPNWTARLEYRYSDFGTVTNRPVVAWSGYTEAHDVIEHAVRVGVSYKFGGGPVVASY